MDTIHHVREVMQQEATGDTASILREQRVMDAWTLPDFSFLIHFRTLAHGMVPPIIIMCPHTSINLT